MRILHKTHSQVIKVENKASIFLTITKHHFAVRMEKVNGLTATSWTHFAAKMKLPSLTGGAVRVKKTQKNLWFVARGSVVFFRHTSRSKIAKLTCFQAKSQN